MEKTAATVIRALQAVILVHTTIYAIEGLCVYYKKYENLRQGRGWWEFE